MKGTLVVVALCGLLCSVSALPATSKQIDDSIDFVPFKETQNGDQPIIDTGAGYDGAFSPLSGFLSNMESLMNKIRQQMENVWSRFPTIRPGNFSDDLPDFPNFGVIAPSFDEIDLGKGNTTSETKIIDGHKVVINQTEYHKDTPNGSAFFKVRVIDVQPPNPNTEKDAEEATTPPSVHVIKDREPLENSVENEIYKNKEVGTKGAPEKLRAI